MYPLDQHTETNYFYSASTDQMPISSGTKDFLKTVLACDYNQRILKLIGTCGSKQLLNTIPLGT